MKDEQALQQAREAIQRGDKQAGKDRLIKILEGNPFQERAAARPPAQPAWVAQPAASAYTSRSAPAFQSNASAQVSEDTYRYAAGLIQSKLPRAQVQDRLVAQGLDRQTAADVVDNLTRLHADARKKSAKKNMLYGALWCIGGIVVTVGTLALAKGGGSFVVAWGAIIFGAIQFFKGLFDFLR
ncbi:MAG: hypothetical protein JW934_24480 [Anaerolineae bacterium]|nr:hypothetical protein [Anaerolineae bacterium]